MIVVPHVHLALADVQYACGGWRLIVILENLEMTLKELILNFYFNFLIIF